MPKVTILQPHPTAPVGRLENWLDECGIDCQLVDLQCERVPAATDWGDGAVVLGGKMNALDVEANPWITDLRAELRAAVEHAVPVLAICLGHQILASAFGGEVVVSHPAGGEHGVFSVVLFQSCANDPVMRSVYCPEATKQGGKDAAILAYESHYDAVVTLPEGANLLAGSQLYPIQAFRIGSALGLQFHPETTPQIMAAHRREQGVVGAEFLSGLLAVDATVVDSARRIAHGFAAQCGGRVPQE
ncbi:MAG: type 1 glutamine amidotransferase [Actinomycetaceae bacterium]|nr:type 1 glutamine amidotransferase [Actinomycetaceae bacterium]